MKSVLLRRLLVPGLPALAVLLAAGCASHEAEQEQPSVEPQAPGSASRTVVAPDRCRLLLTVLEVETVLEGDGPCGKAPCSARVRIDTVFAYGFSFPPVLHAGQVLQARFSYTTQRSDLWFPALKVRYPGVSAGQQVVAEAELSGSVDSPAPSPGLVIGHYTLR
jgi:hypothetical protein